MFKCDNCKETSKAGEKQNKKIIETRDKTYHYTDKHGREATSNGSEIVKEINLCEKCFELLKEVGD